MTLFSEKMTTQQLVSVLKGDNVSINDAAAILDTFIAERLERVIPEIVAMMQDAPNIKVYPNAVRREEKP